jgi:hypothetical protein
MYTFASIDGWSATGDVIAIADRMGDLSAISTVGLFGGPCSVPLPPVFIMENASIDTSDELNADEMYWLLKKKDDYPVPYRDKCENDIDDDGDTRVNDGCPAVGDAEDAGDDPIDWGNNPGSGQFYHALPWAAVTINDAVDTDGDGYSDIGEGVLGSDAGDSDSTPESLVIDAAITAGAGTPPQSGALPAAELAQSCNDGVDNDGDTLTDDDVGCQDDAVSGDADHDGWADDVNVGFDADITADHDGVEWYTGDPALALGVANYDSGMGEIEAGTNAGQCWIVGPGDEDYAAGGTPDNELEAQLFCYGTPQGLWATADLDTDGDPDVMWWKVIADPVDPQGRTTALTTGTPTTAASGTPSRPTPTATARVTSATTTTTRTR